MHETDRARGQDEAESPAAPETPTPEMPATEPASQAESAGPDEDPVL